MVITEIDIILQEYYITRNTKVHHMKRYTKAEGVHEQQEESREPNMRGTGRKSCDDNPSFCCTLIVTEGSAAYSVSYSKATKVRSLGSEHENSGLSDATLRVHIIKPNGMHNGHTCT